MTGQRIAQFEITGRVGQGGMGEVFRARDTRLNREVAVKVLSKDFGADADRLRRFEQESKTLAALNHPNVLTIHDAGVHEGTPYLVSELLEGKTLREEMSGGVFPIRKATDYALQIAQGLAAAHAKGIVHRDLKPENIFVTTDGRAKILDFGLAKLKQPVGADVRRLTSHSPEMKSDSPHVGSCKEEADAATFVEGTEPGRIMGTPGYMSPEQVRGYEADHRCDIFAFGVILYETLAGQRAFHGASAVEVMSAILNEEPANLLEINRGIPAGLDRVVRHCLEKRPERRFQSTTDLSFAIEVLVQPSDTNLQSPLQAREATPIIRPSASRERLGWIVAAIVLLVALALAARSYLQRAPADARLHKLSVPPPDKATLTGGEAPLISPDGSLLAFVATDPSGKNLIYIRPLDSTMAQPLAGTEEAVMPFWSPDSHFLGFVSGGKLKKIAVAGGQPQALANAEVTSRGGAWNRDGVIIFSPSPPDPLYRVSAAGGDSSPISPPDAERKNPRWLPHFLPDGRHYLYLSSASNTGEREICVGSLDSQESKRLLSNPSDGVYAPPGYLLFRRDAMLMAQRFDADKLELAGDPFPIAEQVGFDALTYQGSFSVSANGVLAYHSGASSKTQFGWFDRTGRQSGVAGPPGYYGDPEISPDDKRVAFQQVDYKTGIMNLWLRDLTDSTNSSRFTFSPTIDFAPIWSQDGSRIVFASLRKGPPNLYQKVATGAGDEELLLTSLFPQLPFDWSLDGRFIVYGVVDPKTRWDLWVLPLAKDQPPYPFLHSDANESQAQFSPNGRWVAYVSNESGRDEVYVRPFPAAGGQWQVSTSGGSQPRWRRDGSELFYLSADRTLTAVEVNTAGPTFVVGAPKPLFGTRFGKAGPWSFYAVASDGQRFLINSLIEEANYAAVTVVLNWTASLKK